MADKVYVGDVGTIIDIDVQENISTATNIHFQVLKPGGSEEEWDCTLQGDNQTLRHVVGADELDEAGLYVIQVTLTLGTWTGRCDSVSFSVYEEYE